MSKEPSMKLHKFLVMALPLSGALSILRNLVDLMNRTEEMKVLIQAGYFGLLAAMMCCLLIMLASCVLKILAGIRLHDLRWSGVKLALLGTGGTVLYSLLWVLLVLPDGQMLAQAVMYAIYALILFLYYRKRRPVFDRKWAYATPVQPDQAASVARVPGEIPARQPDLPPTPPTASAPAKPASAASGPSIRLTPVSKPKNVPDQLSLFREPDFEQMEIEPTEDGVQVLKHFGAFSGETGAGHVTKEINRVMWGAYGPYLDIRKWKDGTPKRGIAITAEEEPAFFQLLRTAAPEQFHSDPSPAPAPDPGPVAPSKKPPVAILVLLGLSIVLAVSTLYLAGQYRQLTAEKEQASGEVTTLTEQVSTLEDALYDVNVDLIKMFEQYDYLYGFISVTDPSGYVDYRDMEDSSRQSSSKNRGLHKYDLVYHFDENCPELTSGPVAVRDFVDLILEDYRPCYRCAS